MTCLMNDNFKFHIKEKLLPAFYGNLGAIQKYTIETPEPFLSPIVTQLVNKFILFYVNRRFIIAVKITRS